MPDTTHGRDLEAGLAWTVGRALPGDADAAVVRSAAEEVLSIENCRHLIANLFSERGLRCSLDLRQWISRRALHYPIDPDGQWKWPGMACK